MLEKNNRDIDKIMICNKVSFFKKGFTYFIGYKSYEKKLAIVYNATKNEWILKSIDETKQMSFLLKELLKNVIKSGIKCQKMICLQYSLQ